VQLLPDPRHAEEQGRRDLAQILLDRPNGFAEAHAGAGIDRRHRGEHLLGDVTERQIGEASGLSRDPEPIDRPERLSAHVAVAQHRALGLAGQARGIDHQAHFQEALRVDSGVDETRIVLLEFGAQAFHLVKGGEHVARVMSQALRIDDNDALQLRQFIETLQDLVGLLLILADDELGIRMAEHIGDLVGRACRIDADGDGAHEPGAELANHPLDPVLGQDRDMPARLQAERMQASGAHSRAASAAE
jgi:hypothetical protein